jgi:phosphoglycolate phosphatase-like HAD superfamily hydrolase
MKRLVLFDIDETLIHSDGAGKRAIEFSLAKFFGHPVDLTGHSFSGKTDPQIFNEALNKLNYSLSEIESFFDQIYPLYLGQLEIEINKANTYKLHIGVLELLESLELADWAHLGLLTGNIENGARLKLKQFSLYEKFEIGAFGSDSANRLDLPEIAHKRANTHFQKPFVNSEIVIIGDAINDILCAKHYQAKSIAVNTGVTKKSDLMKHEPHFLFDSLKDTKSMIEAIMA